jgi:hypothetical protein
MQRGTILKAARNDTKAGLIGGAILAGLCVAILGLNWKYLYNSFAGPIPLTAALAQSPGAREWVTASGPLLDTGATETLTLRLRRLPFIKSTSTTARYLMMPIEGRMLLVKVDPDSSGNVVSGRLERLPSDLIAASDTSLVYPMYLNAGGGGGYRSHANIFVIIAVPLLPIAIVITLLSARSRLNISRYKPIARLARYGNPMGIVTAIEMELSAAGRSAKVGPLWVGPNWVVALTPVLRVFKLADIVAVAAVTTPGKKSKPATHEVWFWVSGHMLREPIVMTEQETRAVVTALAAKVPGIVTDDPKAFGDRWNVDRAACEREAKTRRTLPRSA